KLGDAVGRSLLTMLVDNKDPTRQLRALWALHARGAVGENTLAFVLAAPELFSAPVRCWAVRLLAEELPVTDSAVKELRRAASAEKDPHVRLALACALQRLPVATRMGLARSLASGEGTETADRNLSLLLWYGVEPAVLASPDA